MNAIIGFTVLATAHIDNTELVLDYLKKIRTSGQHLLSLINDVLDMLSACFAARSSAGQRPEAIRFPRLARSLCSRDSLLPLRLR